MIYRRAYPRISEEAEAIIKVLTAPEDQELEGRLLSGVTLDVSTCGLQLHGNAPIPVGSILEIDVVWKRPTKTIQHIGRVVWLKENEDDAHSCNFGVKFIRTPDSSLAAWRAIISSRLSHVSAMSQTA
jgi:hypothetical protein